MPTNTPPVGWHPEEYELADLLDAWDSRRELDPRSELGAIGAHVTDCPVCRAVLTRAGASGLRPEASAAAATFAVDAPALTALVEHRVSTPAAGQVWRLRAPSPDGPGDIADLVAVVAAEEDVLVAPLTSDMPEQTDMWVQHLPFVGTDVAMGAWVSLATPVGLETLDVHVADVDPTPLAETWRCLRRADAPPQAQAGTRTMDAELRRYREQLRSRLAVFADARLLPQTEIGEGTDARTAMAAANWAPTDLASAAHITPGRARRVLRGDADLTTEQLQAVGDELGVPVIGGRSAAPEAKVRAVATPVRRHRFEVLAQVQGEDGWRYRAEQCNFTLAARASRGTDADWDELVEQHLVRLERDLLEVRD